MLWYTEFSTLVYGWLVSGIRSGYAGVRRLSGEAIVLPYESGAKLFGKTYSFSCFPVFDLGARILQEMPCKNNISDTSRCCLQFALRIQLI